MQSTYWILWFLLLIFETSRYICFMFSDSYLPCEDWRYAFRKERLTFLCDYLFWGAGVLNKTSNKKKIRGIVNVVMTWVQFRSVVLKSCHLMVTRWPMTQSGFLKDRCVLGWSNKITTCRKMGRAVLAALMLTSPAMRLGDPANCEGKKYWAIGVGRRVYTYWSQGLL